MTSSQDVKAFAMSRKGYVLDRKYTILDYIGHGGMSIVYLARDRRLNKTWAIKEFRQTGHQVKDDVFRKSLLEEANLMKGLSHPALPRIVDIIEADGTIFIVMDYIDGMNLKSVMKRQGHPMDQDDVIDWGIQLCDVLDYLHTPDPKKEKPRIVYRDMKPENVMLRDDGTVCLIDFGIARKFDDGKAQDTNILGTREYAAPEQLDPTVQTDWRADIYSLGVTLHYLVTGHDPKKNIFQTQPIRDYNPQLDEGLDLIIQRCVNYDREQRYQSCREIAYDLEHHETLSQGYRKRLQKKLHTFTGLCIAAAVCLVVGGVGMALSASEKASTYDAYMGTGDNILLDASTEGYQQALDQKVEAYASAIEVDPTQAEPYERCLEALTDDGVLTANEASRYYNLMDKSASSCDEYPTLCYSFASAYFNYTKNYAQAQTWFENAKRTGELSPELEANADAYIVICDFNKTIDSRELSGDADSPVFVEYWDKLCEACDNVTQVDVAPRSKLRVYELIVDACCAEPITVSLRRGGVTQEQLLERVNEVRGLTQQLQSSDVIYQTDVDLCDEILSHFKEGDGTAVNVYAVLERTFGKSQMRQSESAAAGAGA